MNKQNNTGSCIFCGRTGNLTKQHVFSDWLKQLIPRNPKGSLHFKSPSHFVPSSTFEHSRQIYKSSQGDVGTRKIRNVCAGCNGGWMSVIEGNVKSILSELIQGTAATITEKEKLEISKWIVQTCIMGEYVHPEDRSIQSYHRRYFMNNLQPGPGWQIWIGKYAGNDDKIVYRHGGGLLLDAQDYDPRTFSKIDHPNLFQCTTIVLDRLFIVGATLPTQYVRGLFNGLLLNYSSSLTQIWPGTKSARWWIPLFLRLGPRFSSSWPASDSLSDTDVLNISNIVAMMQEIMAESGSHIFRN